MNLLSKIYVAGHRGMVGSAIVRKLKKDGYKNLIYADKAKLDLTNLMEVQTFIKSEKPDYVFLAAAKVGGILSNRDFPADYFFENLKIELNVIQSSYENSVKRLCFLGSTCIYPRDAAQPLKEDCLLTGPLEKTNEAYAIAKIAGIKLINAYRKQSGRRWISAMPTNLYGPNDNFDFESSHVLPALIAKFHEAKTTGNSSVTLWGDGTPLREFLHVDDLAKACLLLLEKYDDSVAINVGSGSEVSIRELAGMIQKTVGFAGDIEFDTSRPNGTPRKILSIKRIQSLGWDPQIKLEEGLASTYEWFKQNALSKV